MEHDNSGQAFSVGEVLATSFAILFRNIVPFGILSVLVLSPTLFFGLAIIGSPIDPAVSMIVGAVLSIFLTAAVTGALVYGTSRQLGGHKVAIGECLGRGLATALPVIGVIILMTLGMTIGMLLLVIPGIILYVMWWVALPVAVIERPGVVASLKRSAALTKGRRWHVFGILLLIILLSAVLSFLLRSFEGDVVVGIVLSLLVNAFSAALGAVVGAVGYYRLRGEKEGLGVESIASVFD